MPILVLVAMPELWGHTDCIHESVRWVHRGHGFHERVTPRDAEKHSMLCADHRCCSGCGTSTCSACKPRRLGRFACWLCQCHQKRARCGVQIKVSVLRLHECAAANTCEQSATTPWAQFTISCLLVLCLHVRAPQPMQQLQSCLRSDLIHSCCPNALPVPSVLCVLEPLA